MTKEEIENINERLDSLETKINTLETKMDKILNFSKKLGGKMGINLSKDGRTY